MYRIYTNRGRLRIEAGLLIEAGSRIEAGSCAAFRPRPLNFACVCMYLRVSSYLATATVTVATIFKRKCYDATFKLRLLNCAEKESKGCRCKRLRCRREENPQPKRQSNCATYMRWSPTTLSFRIKRCAKIPG